MHFWPVGTNTWKLIRNLLSDTQRGDKICFIVTSLPRPSSRWWQQNLQMSAPDGLQQLLFGHTQDWMGLIPGRTWSRPSSWSMQSFQVNSTTSSILHFYLESFLQDLSISEDFCCRHKLSHHPGQRTVKCLHFQLIPSYLSADTIYLLVQWSESAPSTTSDAKNFNPVLLCWLQTSASLLYINIYAIIYIKCAIRCVVVGGSKSVTPYS